MTRQEAEALSDMLGEGIKKNTDVGAVVRNLIIAEAYKAEFNYLQTGISLICSLGSEMCNLLGDSVLPIVEESIDTDDMLRHFIEEPPMDEG